MILPSVTKYPQTVSQDSSYPFVGWDELNNIKKNVEGAYAVSRRLIEGKTEAYSVPADIHCKNFGFNLPVGAEPTKVTITYRYRKVAGSDYSAQHPKRICNIPAPQFVLYSGDHSVAYGKGTAPIADMKTYTKSFNVTGKLSRSQANSSNLEVYWNFGSNTNAYNGYLRIGFLRVTLEYKVPSYSVSVSKRSGSGYNGEDYSVKLSISNKNRTAFNPTLTLVSPIGFSFKKFDGDGTVSQVNARTFTWNPKLNSGAGTRNVELTFSTNVIYPSGSEVYTGTFSLSESLYSATAYHTARITERPPSKQKETEPDTTDINVESKDQYRIYHCQKLEPFEYSFTLTQEELAHILPDIFDIKTIYFRSEELEYLADDNNWHDFITIARFDSDNTDPNVTFTVRAKEIGTAEVTVKFDNSDSERELLATFIFDVRPEEEDLTTPNFSVLEITGEELDRLGNGYPYIVQTYIKHETADTYERDWYKNNRIGVFNNAIEENVTIETIVDPETGEIIETVVDSTDYENLTDQEIFENAAYWSPAPTTVNEFNNLECEFPYNHDYPLHILLTGDYEEAEDFNYDAGNITFTEPCVIEKNVYTARESNGNYFFPIGNLIDHSVSEISIENGNASTTIVLYDFPLDDHFGSDETHSIRGFEVVGRIEHSDELVLNAKLVSPDGNSGSRTVVLSDQDTEVDGVNDFRFGGLGDLWGFSTSDLQDLEDWSLQIFANNILIEDLANLNLGDIQLIFYLETLKKQTINIKVNGEDLSYYGAFIDDVDIPEGLDTDTSFLTIDGTDTNDAYRQNIREKTISVEFNIGECDLQTSTDMLRQLTKILVNEKDNYNRPIPNRIEFSHYPDLFFEYIMTKSMDITNEQGTYKVKANLTIPAGTGYSKQSTTTNVVGFVQGLAAVNPIITFKPQANEITISESNSQQSFHMGFSGDWQSKIVEINCEDRVVLLKTDEDDVFPIDITKYVDFNSDWFDLYGEYNLSGVGCVIRTCTYTERW